MFPLWCRRRRPQRRPRCRLLVERLADRILPAATSLIQPNDRLDATIGAPGEVDRFQFTLTDTGRLTVHTAGLDLDTRTSLLDADAARWDREAAELRSQYEQQAVQLLRQAIELNPAVGRTAFWRDYIEADKVALNPIRNSLGFARLAAEYSGPAR